MPTYCYETTGGEIIERQFSIMAQIPPEITLKGGRKARRSFRAEHAGPSDVTAANWPMECYASGVHPEQAGDLRAEFRRCGVPTEVTRDGNPLYRSAAHRRKALKARGMFDRSAFI